MVIRSEFVVFLFYVSSTSRQDLLAALCPIVSPHPHSHTLELSQSVLDGALHRYIYVASLSVGWRTQRQAGSRVRSRRVGAISVAHKKSNKYN